MYSSSDDVISFLMVLLLVTVLIGLWGAMIAEVIKFLGAGCGV